MSKILTVVCSEKGLGKTTTVAAISSSLATLGLKTLCISFDTEAKMLERALCIDEPEDTFYLEDVNETDSIIDVSYEHMDVANLFYINVQSKGETEELSVSETLSFFAIVRSEFDFCVVDTRPEMCAASRLAHADADISLIVATEDVSTLDAARQLAIDTHEMGIGDVQILINKVNPDNFKSHWEHVDDMLEKIDARLVGLVLEDINISQAAAEHTPLILYRKKLAIHDFLDTARRLTGEIVPWPFHQKQPVISAISVKGVSNTLIGSYGDPETWAHSTLDSDVGKLVKVYEIKPDKNHPLEMVRNRIWLHDALDEEKIRYKVIVSGYWVTRKKYSLSQSVFVKQENRNRVRELVLEWRKLEGAEPVDEEDI